MDDKLERLYNECISELETIGINVKNNPLIGEIDIKIANRNVKRYGCCKHEEPDKNSSHLEKGKKNILVKYDRFLKHHIEISKWVMDLDEKIIKNTIIHEIIHCFPNCNNHQEGFKKYATYINESLGYNISRVGDKADDYQKSNLILEEENNYNYKIICKKCGQTYYRKRLRKNLIKKYRCSKCGGKLQII